MVAWWRSFARLTGRCSRLYPCDQFEQHDSEHLMLRYTDNLHPVDRTTPEFCLRAL